MSYGTVGLCWQLLPGIYVGFVSEVIMSHYHKLETLKLIEYKST
jgi:hypothetical protein